MKKIIKNLTIFSICLILLSSCSSKNESAIPSENNAYYAYDAADAISPEYYSDDFAYNSEQDYGGFDYEEDFDSNNSNENFSSSSIYRQSQRKIILNANINIETKEYDNDVQNIIKSAEKYNGEISNASIEGREGNRIAYYIFRIPSDKYRNFVDEVSEIGVLLQREEYSNDVSTQYTDTDSRIKSLRTQEERLLALMEKSGSLKDLLTIEEALSETQYRIETYTSTLRNYDDAVNYSTVEINISEVSVYIPVEPETLTFSQRLSSSFKSGWRTFSYSFQHIILDIASSLPFIITFLIFVFIAFLIIRVIVKKLKLKRNNSIVKPNIKEDIVNDEKGNSEKPEFDKPDDM